MEVVILRDAKEIGGVAADAVGALLIRIPSAVLGLATGSSPLAIYDELAARCNAGLISFRQARGFTLDEYVGLPTDHPELYRNVIDTAFVSRVDFAPGAVKAIHGSSGGTPRVINTLCDNALFEGYVARAPIIDEGMIARVALDLGLQGGAPPSEIRPPAPAAVKAAATKGKPVDLGEIDRYLAGLAKPS